VPGKEDLFTPIHKGLRSMMYDLARRIQTNDFADLAQTRALVVDLEHDFEVARTAGCMLCIFSMHADEEEEVAFPAVKGFNEGLVATLVAEHHDFSRREKAITQVAHALLETASPQERVAAGVHLNQTVNELLAAYLVHLNREESDLVPLMREHLTDPQQAQMRGTIIGKMAPDRLFAILGWMLPSLNVTELSELMVEIKGHSPPRVLEAVTQLGEAKVDPARWATVRARVGI
jgi:hypothetical protein